MHVPHVRGKERKRERERMDSGEARYEARISSISVIRIKHVPRCDRGSRWWIEGWGRGKVARQEEQLDRC